jgi:putative hydroxymethylpyrimidine transport system permease protein
MSMIWRALVVTVGLLMIWQLVIIIFQLPDYILPSPQLVFSTLLEQRILIIQQTLPTLIESGAGLLLGILFGCSTALIISYFRPLARWLLPLIIISQAVPTFAIAPLLVIWFGFGITSKIITAILMIFFPITSALYDGLQKTNSGWHDLAATMNASRWRTFVTITLPAALPSLASGIRIAAVTAPIGAIVGEWVGASQGLGYLMLNANARMQIDMMFAVLLVIIALSLSLYFTVDKLLARLIWWHD